MPPIQDDSALSDFCELSPELTRPYRGLRVWLPLKMHGLGPFREALDEKLDLARWAVDELRKIEGIEILAEPELSLLAFQWAPPGADLGTEELNHLNRRLLERINERRRVLLTGTLLHGRFAIRMCILSFRTHRDRVEIAVENVREAVGEMKRAR